MYSVTKHEHRPFYEMLLEDIDIMLKSSFITPTLRARILGFPDVNCIDDFKTSVYLYIMTHSKAHIKQWRDTSWDYEDQEKRTEHRAWIKQRVNNLIRNMTTSVNNDPTIGGVDVALIDLYKTQFANTDKNALLDILDLAANTPFTNDLLKWKLGMLTDDQICEEHSISRRTLTRKYNALKQRCVAVAMVEGLI